MLHNTTSEIERAAFRYFRSPVNTGYTGLAKKFIRVNSAWPHLNELFGQFQETAKSKSFSCVEGRVMWLHWFTYSPGLGSTGHCLSPRSKVVTVRALLEKNDPRISLVRFYFLNLAMRKPVLHQIHLHKNTIWNSHDFFFKYKGKIGTVNKLQNVRFVGRERRVVTGEKGRVLWNGCFLQVLSCLMKIVPWSVWL